MSTVYQSEPGSSGRKEKFLMGLQMIFATITLTELLIIFFASGVVSARLLTVHNTNINHASVAEAD